LIINYWLNSDSKFLEGMGVDLSRMPTKEQWIELLSQQLEQDYPDKESYCILWLVDDKPIGHCNINKILFGKEAAMHLHIWNKEERNSGYGFSLLKMTIPYFFRQMQLKKLYSEPYALNPAPNKILEKLGFSFIKEYVTIPGLLNFEQPVKRWELSKEKFEEMYNV
jgi:RimJ/RimL family protein N-acetyltransferase